MARLKENEQIFISEYIKDRNASRAYQIAHPQATPATCRVEGCKLRKKKTIKPIIDAKLAELLESNEITAERVLQEDGRIAFSDITPMFPEFDFPDELRPAIKSIKVTERTVFSKDGEFGETVRTIEMALWDKGKSLDRLGKYLKLYAGDDEGDLGDLELKLTLARNRINEATEEVERERDLSKIH